jgi:hypothetical protein
MVRAPRARTDAATRERAMPVTQRSVRPSAWVRKRIGISGAPGISTTVAAMAVTAPKLR